MFWFKLTEEGMWSILNSVCSPAQQLSSMFWLGLMSRWNGIQPSTCERSSSQCCDSTGAAVRAVMASHKDIGHRMEQIIFCLGLLSLRWLSKIYRKWLKNHLIASLNFSFSQTESFCYHPRFYYPWLHRVATQYKQAIMCLLRGEELVSIFHTLLELPLDWPLTCQQLMMMIRTIISVDTSTLIGWPRTLINRQIRILSLHNWNVCWLSMLGFLPSSAVLHEGVG